MKNIYYEKDRETIIEEKLTIAFELAGVSTQNNINKKLREFTNVLMPYIEMKPLKIAEIIEQRGYIG